MTDRNEKGQFTEGNSAACNSGYDPETHPVQVAKLCKLGATDQEIADFFGISTRTFYRWKSEHVPFCQAVTCAKEEADKRVERSLYQRAVGYEHEAVKIFLPKDSREPVYAPYRQHVPADPGAAFNWLKNRNPEEWRDKKELEHKGLTVVIDREDGDL